ncbi:hypothetical protein DV451_003206 [Geotrichum candidum]|uniref:Acyl-ACP thioesterase-like C-terminal domain-containing protein n=1 Tax=Geotrichum candidum TaxID=1173061 RepID=A0A9P5G4F1_GEOCN|nr:hypothetical protein DV451_003206 [Geotrichum candidum]KAF5106798.1 hypothetical protein DV453_003614 [Geotrichum candidum]
MLARPGPLAAAATAARSVTTGARALDPETRKMLGEILATEDAATQKQANGGAINHYRLESGGLVNHDIFWGDMDTFGHVNNVMYLKWFETVNYFRALLGSDADKFMGGVGVGPIIRSVDLAWRYPDRFELSGVVVSHKAKKVAARIREVIVTVDYSNGGVKAPIPGDVRKILEKQWQLQQQPLETK